MKLLAIDTAAALCAACVLDTASGVEEGRSVRDVGKGHAEHLIQTIGEALRQAETSYAAVGGIAVSVGPGSFTGIRVGVAAARGLALALKIPATGVTTLEALATEARQSACGRAVLSLIDGRRGDVYAALYGPDGALRAGPAALTLEEAAELAATHRAILTGSGAAAVAPLVGAPAEIVSHAASADIAVYAQLAAAKGPQAEKPKPLYLRGADARPQDGFALPRKSA
jgi:tRNA threonylcarbamoyladenosine biosynthesis protein TsaB